MGHFLPLPMFKKASLVSVVKASDVAKMEKLSKNKHFARDCTHNYDKAGYSALTQAALQGEPAILEVMLEANVDPNAKDRHDRTPLYVAALCDRGNIAKVLTKCEDINVDMVCTDGQTATEAATISGSKDVLKAIGDVMGAELVAAGKAGDLDRVKKLVQRPMINTEASDSTGWTALHFAMNSGFEEMVEVLAAAGADGNYKNMAGDSPLDLALKMGNRAILRLYEETMEGKGRLEKKEREREKEPEKQVGVLKEKAEGTADAHFTHKKITQEELIALEKKNIEKKQKAAMEEAVSPRSPKTPDPLSPRRYEVQVKGGWKHTGETHPTSPAS